LKLGRQSGLGRWGWALITLTLGLAALVGVQSYAPWAIAYNGTPSLRGGFYLAERNPVGILPGDIVCMSAAYPTVPGWVATRQYLPAGMPLCKRVLLAGGGWVVRTGNTLRLCPPGGAQCRASELQLRDSRGRAMQSAFAVGATPVPGAMLYLHSGHAGGLDSRYLGLVKAEQAQSRLTPFWTW
jgi:type IV secretory pathway protease TraF